MGLKFTNAPMPPREITFTGTNKEFQQLAQWLENSAVAMQEFDNTMLINPNVRNLIDALRGAE